MSVYPTDAYAHPRPKTSATESNAAAGRAGAAPPRLAGNANVRDSSTGTGLSALAGVRIVSVIFGPSALSPIRPTTVRCTAVPLRAFSSVAVTSHDTFGAFTGMRP